MLLLFIAVLPHAKKQLHEIHCSGCLFLDTIPMFRKNGGTHHLDVDGSFKDMNAVKLYRQPVSTSSVNSSMQLHMRTSSGNSIEILPPEHIQVGSEF